MFVYDAAAWRALVFANLSVPGAERNMQSLFLKSSQEAILGATGTAMTDINYKNLDSMLGSGES